jgi:hypothetical protein
MNRFVQSQAKSDAYWRGIILFGRNSATYKFALAKCLLASPDLRLLEMWTTRDVRSNQKDDIWLNIILRKHAVSRSDDQ